MYFKIQNETKNPKDKKTKVRAMNEQNCANDRERFILLSVAFKKKKEFSFKGFYKFAREQYFLLNYFMRNKHLKNSKITR